MTRFFCALIFCGGIFFAGRECVLAQVPVGAARKPTMEESLGLVMQIVERLRGYVGARDLANIHNQDIALNVALSGLMRESARIEESRRNEFQVDVLNFSRKVSRLHAAGDAANQAQAEAELQVVVTAFTQFKKFFPAEVVKAATLLADPACNPATGGQASGLAAFHRPDAAVTPSVRAAAQMSAPLQQGELNRVMLRLLRTNEVAVRFEELQEVHEARIHLLVIDPSLTDYHHLHPQPTGTPGEFSFAFAPRRTGPYRVWADVRVAPMHLQEYALVDLPGLGPAGVLSERAVSSRVQVDGFNFEMTFATPVIKAGVATVAKLRVSGVDGRGFDQLEPLMGAFAHLVGFHEDYRTVLHLHPRGPAVRGAGERGGPELEFAIFAAKAGFYRLFAQVQIGGISKFAPFGVVVAQ